MIDRTHRYTDREIEYIIDHLRGRGLPDDWDYLEQCAETERIRSECRHHWLRAYHADEMLSFDEL